MKRPRGYRHPLWRSYRTASRRALARLRRHINKAARGHMRGYNGQTTQQARAVMWAFVEFGAQPSAAWARR